MYYSLNKVESKQTNKLYDDTVWSNHPRMTAADRVCGCGWGGVRRKDLADTGDGGGDCWGFWVLRQVKGQDSADDALPLL